MKIGITTFGCDGGRSGIGRFLLSMLDCFENRFDQHEFVIWTTAEEADVWRRDSSRFSLRTASERFGGAFSSVVWHQTHLPRECRLAEVDAVWFPAANRRLGGRNSVPAVGSVLDLASLHLPGKYSWKHDLYLRYVLPRMINRLDEIMTISEYSKRDIIAATGCAAERVTVIPLGVDQLQFHPGDASLARSAVSTALGVDAPYLLYVSRLEHPAKNHVRLIESFERLIAEHAPPHHLILAGPDWNRAEVIHSRIHQSPLRQRIHTTGFLPQSLIPELYRAADLCVIPSLYEGFGMPVIEAMACGVPVALSNRTSLPEVAGGRAAVFEPDDLEAMTDCLALCLLDQPWREQASIGGLGHAATFRWEQTAERLLRLLARACGRPEASPAATEMSQDENASESAKVDQPIHESQGLPLVDGEVGAQPLMAAGSMAGGAR